ncbi:MAG: PAS domain S-box protein [Deltaproteobacteria bacterium]|jgi:histidine kinase|nr:PAS domain S-box protein [Deltaproteobacteria bacterium]
MKNLFKKIRRSLASKLILTVGLTLLVTITTWAYFNIDYQETKLMKNVVVGTDRLTNTIKLGTHYAMMLNSRDDINQIINNIGRQKEIESIRIYNKEGQIKFSNQPAELETKTNIKDEACYICHRTEPPLSELELDERTRIFTSEQGYRLLGIISPIRNEEGCATDACHVHPQDKKILGALDVVVSLEDTDTELFLAKKGAIFLAGGVFLVTSAIIFLFQLRFVTRPIRKLIGGTRRIATGDYRSAVDIRQDDEMGQLAGAIEQMSEKIAAKQAELNEQRNEYQTLFERAPCLITVQDRDFKLLRFNREFAERFDSRPGQYCYEAYKGRTEKCLNCPVERTFNDGQIHNGEESGIDKDGTMMHWMLRTSPIFNTRGDIVAAMEMSVDITHRRQLEDELEKSEKKYHEIFNHIPNPVFVLDAESLEIIDCNDSVKPVYGLGKDEVIYASFMDLFAQDEKDQYTGKIKKSAVINRVKHLNRNGKILFVNIRISPAEYPGKKVLLVTISDITQRLETEQQLIQASKMATLGEMATGVAHELNQPLSVIKTASSFSIKKLNKREPISTETLCDLLDKIDGNVDRATKIINHMRQFARKSDLDFEKVQVNDVMQSAFEIFSQQLILRGIEVIWDLEPELPKINADPSRLEQVFINILINARDSIEERWGPEESEKTDKRIVLKTRREKDVVISEVCDTGMGIPESIKEKIFEPFFTTKEVGKGTGLGLSISYGIIKDCGGSIRVRPNTPEGACFIIQFPIPTANHGK